MDNILLIILGSIILFLPAFAANPGAVITGGYAKVDFGRNFIDGKRIFGDGKTWSGFFGGSFLGVALGLVIYFILSLTHITAIGNYGSSVYEALAVLLPMSFGSLMGDMAGSFVKRRLNMKRGQKGSLLDQWPFVLVSFLMVFIFARGFFMEYYGNFIGIIVILAMTPPLHRAVNIIGYKMNKKDVPW